jgi:hypothetical protein
MHDRTSDVLEAAAPDIVAGYDGTYLYWPTENRGAWTADDLRIIAAKLDALNGQFSGSC